MKRSQLILPHKFNSKNYFDYCVHFGALWTPSSAIYFQRLAIDSTSSTDITLLVLDTIHHNTFLHIDINLLKNITSTVLPIYIHTYTTVIATLSLTYINQSYEAEQKLQKKWSSAQRGSQTTTICMRSCVDITFCAKSLIVTFDIPHLFYIQLHK